MKVVTWNLGYWDHRETHGEAWTYLLETLEPDLAILQEIQPLEEMTDENLAFQEAHRGWGTAVYSRDLPLSEIPLCEDHPGRVAGVSVSLPNGEQLSLASIHAKSDPVFPRLAEIMDEIMNRFGDRTAIVGGDLNSARLAEEAWPGWGHQQFWEWMDSPSSSLVDCCQRVNGRELQTIFREGAKYPFQDDHLFVSSNLESGLQGCDVIHTEVTRRVSDHIPLFVELDT